MISDTLFSNAQAIFCDFSGDEIGSVWSEESNYFGLILGKKEPVKFSTFKAAVNFIESAASRKRTDPVKTIFQNQFQTSLF